MAHTNDNKYYYYYNNLPLSCSGPLECSLTGYQLLKSPYHNKGSAFPPSERKTFRLHGKLPPNVQTLDEQVQRAYEQYSSRPDALAKNVFMTSMKDQNIVLFYRLIQDHLKEMFSIIYTPTESDAIQNYSRIFRRPEGCFLNIFDSDRIEDNLAQFGDADDVDYIVVTDGEEILGIGDQGVGGILISVAKLVLTTLCAGIHPSRTLPVVLDCGTDNEQLLNDDLYLGLKRPRIRGKEYDNFVDTFVKSVSKLFPKTYLHFEDFGLPNARRILDLYRPEIACFNDDVQGTGCVTLAAIMAGLHAANLHLTSIRIVIFGAGTAGTGIADQVRDAIVAESGGTKSKDEAARQIWCVDRPGLLFKSHGDALTAAQVQYARDDAEWEDETETGSGKNRKGEDAKTLLGVIRQVKPHVLVGTSTRPKAFTEEVVREMVSHVSRPIILPLSNPTRLHEADPKDLYEWTEDMALVATGSPFPPIEYVTTAGEKRYHDVAECNNSTCFPGIGLGAVLCRASRVTDKMLVAAVKALARQSPAIMTSDGDKGLLPDVVDVREISVKIAVAVIRQAMEEGVSRVELDLDLNHGTQSPETDHDAELELEEWVRVQMWDPVYRPLVRVGEGMGDKLARGEAGIGASK